MENSFVIIIPNIRSRHNVGALFRAADGAGVSKVYLTGYTPHPPHKDIEKVALGAEKSVSWEHVRQTARIIKKLSSEGYCIVGLEQTKKSVTIYEWVPQFPLAIILGNEVTGIPPAIKKLCDTMVEIPMKGSKNSLNVSVAAGIVMYHTSKFCT